MKAAKNILIAFLCSGMLLSTGCSAFQGMSKSGQNAIIGGTAGGAVGAGIGALIGGGKGTWIGALIGSAIGAGAGAAVGHQMDKQKSELEKELADVKSQVDQNTNEINNIKVETVKDSNNLNAIKVVLGDAILFKTGSSVLTPAADAALSKIAYNLNQNPKTFATIVGNTDNTGGLELNMQLSQQRANAVMNYLISQGVAASRLKAIGDGPNNPIVPNTTAAGRAQNRRVDIYITANEQMINEAQMGQ